jgi:hypothetical protein
MAVRRFRPRGERVPANHTPIATVKLNDISPQARLADVLARIADDLPPPRLLPGIVRRQGSWE